jgi:AcrR family transcriptional regulator
MARSPYDDYHGSDRHLSVSGRRPDSETRHAQILNAAAEVFARRGYQRATVKEIARQAGIAAGTIYLYFENKRDLLLAIADRLIGQAWEQTQAEMAQLGAEEYITAVLHNTFDFIRQNQPFVQALVTEIWTDAELQDRFFNQVLAPIFETGASYLDAQIAAGRARLCRVGVVIPTIAGSLVMLSLFHSLAPDQFLVGLSEGDLVSELTELYLHGLGSDLGKGMP